MNDVKIALTQQLSDATRQKMSAGLLAYEKSHGINVDYQSFALELLDEQGDVIGVLEAFSSYSCIHFKIYGLMKPIGVGDMADDLLLRLKNMQHQRVFIISIQ